MVLSLFVLPGLGHVSLGAKKKGYLIAFLVCFLSLILLVIFEWKLMAALNRLDDPRTMFARILPVSGEIWKNNPLFFWGGLAVMAALWIYAAVDLWICRKKGDQQANLAGT